MATNSELLSRRNQAVARGVASIHQRFAQRAENALLAGVLVYLTF
ncbi:MAG: hypothetical protein WBN30_01230 [Polyangiales bacterium]